MKNIIKNIGGSIFYCKEKKKLALYKLKLQVSTQKHWPHDLVFLEDLIREDWDYDEDEKTRRYKYIVFIDKELDIDWITSGKCNDDSEKICLATALESIPHKHLPKSQILAFKNLIGEAIVSVLEGHPEEADALINEARKYIYERSIECSRKWMLEYSTILVSPVCIFGLIISHENIDFWYNPSNLWFLGCFWGIIGAYLSIIKNTGKEKLDSSAGAWLHFLRVISKMMMGGSLGIISYFILRSSLLCPPVFDEFQNSYFGFCIFGFVAGFLEHFIPNIIASCTKEKG